ncbi:hypothetical protein MNBD_PLANCTO03-227 [hydrothermal vent metagenome]|uniref:Uncharacterized protein n=1 Tax=hydrothermal vent metagenome TaxID=652676 RepID=A0A3B1DQE2_9ZZZZ
MRTISSVAPFALAMTLVLGAPAVLAQDAPPEPLDSTPDPWTIKFEPNAWYVATSGNIALPGSAGSGNGSTFSVATLNLDSPRLSPLGELQLRRGDWRINAQGLGFSTDDRSSVRLGSGQIGDAPYSAGDTLRSSIDLFIFAVDGAYALHTYETGILDSGQPKFRATLLALAGVRAIDASVDAQVFGPGASLPSATAGGNGFNAHPYAGLRGEMDIYEDFTIDLLGSVGGFSLGESQSWSADIMVGFQWNPTPHFGAQIGYRRLLFGIERGEAPTEFAWNGSLAGVYVGATLRF